MSADLATCSILDAPKAIVTNLMLGMHNGTQCCPPEKIKDDMKALNFWHSFDPPPVRIYETTNGVGTAVNIVLTLLVVVNTGTGLTVLDAQLFCHVTA